jgi:hypothetical protein
MNQKHTRSATGFTLPNQSAIESYAIGRSNTYSEDRRFVVDRDSSGANPLFDLAA